MTTNRYEIHHPTRISVCIREEDQDGMGHEVMSVDVYFDRKYGCAPTAEVNWGAFGSQPPETARQYAQMILRATELADDLNAGRLTLPDRPVANLVDPATEWPTRNGNDVEAL